MKYPKWFLLSVLLISTFACSSKSQTPNEGNRSNLDAEVAKIKTQLQSDPHSSELHAQLAALEAAKGDSQTAEAELATAIRLDPTQLTNYFSASEMFRRRGLTDKAFEMLNNGLKIDPQNPLTHFFLGILYEHESDTANARLELEKAKNLFDELRFAPPTAKRRIEADTYYDDHGNTYVLNHLETRVRQHLVQLSSKKH